MPKRNSINFKDFCLQVIADKVEIMKNYLTCLPYTLINELCERKNYFGLDLEKLPLEILINEKTTKLDFLNILNLPHREITDEMYNRTDKYIQRACENCLVNNVTYINLSFCHSVKPSLQTKLIEHFHQIQILKVVECGSDQLLAAISRHCTQLRHLDTTSSSRVTDVGIESLCFNKEIKLNYLGIEGTKVTASGCLHTLKNMKFLKVFTHSCCDELFEMLRLEINSTSAYSSIEKITWGLMKNTLNEEKLNIVIVAFPNLRTLAVSEINFNHIVVRNYLEKITDLTLETENIDIKLLGLCCPIIEKLQLRITNFTNSQNDWSIPNQTPFKRLWFLFLICSGNDVPKKDLTLLLANCQDLERLILESCQTLTDDFIINMIKVNPFYHLTRLSIYNCNNISVISLMAMFQVDNFLNRVLIGNCALLNELELTQLESYAITHNLDVVVELDNDA